MKKVAKKATAKKAVVRKATAKKPVAKKAPARKVATPAVVPAAVSTPSRDRVNVSTSPAPVKAATPAKPSAAPRQGSSKSVLVAVLVGVAILVAIVASQQSKTDSDVAETPAVTETASPEASATPEATEEAAAATTGEAPSRFIGNWKDASTKEVLVLTWRAPAGDVTGYKVEIAPNGGAWQEVSEIPATQLSFELTKTTDSKYTSFRVSAIYSDGSVGVATPFGFAGLYE